VRIRKQYVLICFLFWTTIVGLEFAGNYFQDIIWEKDVYWNEVIPYASAWYLWFFFSFPVALFAKRFSYPGSSIKQFLLAHFLFFLLINAVHTICATAYIDFLLKVLTNENRRSVIDKLAISGSFYNFIIYSGIVGIILGIKYYRDLQNEKNASLVLQKQLTESRLSFLKQQLHPHFLFNAHHSVITLMKIGEKEKSIEMMEKLSDLMRFSLRENANLEIRLEREIHLLQLYLDIQELRFEDKLNVTFDIDPVLNEALIPSMILQPLVENSIKYAVEGSSSQSSIVVGAHKVVDSMILSVEDSTEEPLERPAVLKGIGLTNTEERLKTMYGSQHEFDYRHVNNNRRQGWRVTIKIPLHYV
jgi:two-component system, LytTR family, sensor kinase